jgi:ribosome-associated toxin RatA of RatAB toxin-antitoxin module
VRAEAQLQADQRSAWQTVTDYEHLPQFVPGIRRVQVLARLAQGATERLLVEHSGEFRWLWFSQPVQVWLEVTHEVPERVQAHSVLPSGVSVERSTLRDFEGSYRLEAIDAGRTRLVYRARFEPAQPLLPLFGALAIRHSASEQFNALTAEIERRAARGRIEQAAR